MERSITRILITIISLLFFSFQSSAQRRFHNITIKDGIPSNRIQFCLRDSKGFTWFATDFGICRYDGVRNTLFNGTISSALGLTESNFTSIFQKNNDELLFISYKGSVFSWKYSTGKFENLSTNRTAFQNVNPSFIYKETKDRYWICTEKGLLLSDSSFNLIKEFNLQPDFGGLNVSNRVLTLLKDRKGIFWLGMYSRTLLLFDPKSGKFSSGELSSFLPPLQQVSSIISSPDSNHIFIATAGEGIYKININNFSHYNWRFREKNPSSLPSDRITSLLLQTDTLLWAGSIDGLACINLKTNLITRYFHNPQNPYSLINNQVNKLLLDSQGILWISTFGGVSKYYTLQNRFTKISQDVTLFNSISSNIVNHCVEDKFGNLWLATSKGIDIRDRSTGIFFHYNLPKSNTHHHNEEIVKFFIDGNVWWIGTWGGGLSRFSLPNNFSPGDKLSFTNFTNNPDNSSSLSSNFIRSIAKDINGNLWITTWNGGLNMISANSKNSTTIDFKRFQPNGDPAKSVASNFIDNIVIGPEKDLWLATSEGLQHISFEKNLFEIIKSSDYPPQDPMNSVTCMIKDDSNVLWLGTFGGLAKIDLTKKPYRFDTIYNNSEHSIFSLIIDRNGTLWFSTLNSEIGNYNRTNGKIEFYSMIQEVDGYDFYLGDATIDRRGNIYFPGRSGYLNFNPLQINKNLFIPPIYITSLKVNGSDYFSGKDITQVKNIDLDYDQNNLSIGFAALNYINSENNNYKYNLEGFSKNWITLGKRSVIDFVNLPSGNYNLKIIGSNNDGIWNEKGIRLSINIAPPFYENFYFRLLILALFVAGIFIYFHSKVSRLKEEKSRRDLFSKLLIDSQEDERKRLSKELHDSLGQNLLVIKNRLALFQMNENPDPEEISDLSDLIKESIDEVKEISSNLHPHQLERLGFNKAIQSMINKISASSNISIELISDDITGLLSRDREINLYRIIQESLNNIVKHSDSQKALIEILRSDNLIKVRVEDYGKGFDFYGTEIDKNLIEGLGLKSINERARILGSELKIESGIGKGTKIYLTFNIN